eukprot:TRINITY_DN44060_c0_g1_i1.p2 TRINITY_DN44060_c0_g1~~TRINITY_DN44060_c0_g1_i1.p2  ORF type:complete len:225 (+),score=53.64 TRINITY_DN44060_c0_g1_i1:145-819(+)
MSSPLHLLLHTLQYTLPSPAHSTQEDLQQGCGAGRPAPTLHTSFPVSRQIDIGTMRVLACGVLCLAVALHCTATEADPSFSWYTCKEAQMRASATALRLQVDGLSATPVPLVTSGSVNLTVSINMTLAGTDPVTNGTLAATLSFGGVPVSQGDWGVCDLIKKSVGPTIPPNLACPLSPGSMNLSVSFPFAAMNYTGLMSGLSRITDQGGNEVACIAFSLPVQPS